MYDAHFLDHEPWQLKTIKQIGIELREEDFDSIGDIITHVSDNAVLKNARQQVKQNAWHYQGEAGKRIAGFMIETVEKLNTTEALNCKQ
jgi:hypothetical protein